MYTAHVGQAASDTLDPDVLCHAVYQHVSSAIGPTAPKVHRKGVGRAAKLSFIFPSVPTAESSNLRRAVSHAGHWSFRFNDSDVLIPTHIGEPLLPPHHLTLRFFHIPLSFSRVSLPAVVLSMAGYRVIAANAPDASAPPGSTGVVYLLLIRLGMSGGPYPVDDPTRFIIEVIPPLDDPHLSHLPAFLPFAEGHLAMSTFVHKDPLHPGPGRLAVLPEVLDAGWESPPLGQVPVTITVPTPPPCPTLMAPAVAPSPLPRRPLPILPPPDTRRPGPTLTPSDMYPMIDMGSLVGVQRHVGDQPSFRRAPLPPLPLSNQFSPLENIEEVDEAMDVAAEAPCLSPSMTVASPRRPLPVPPRLPPPRTARGFQVGRNRGVTQTRHQRYPQLLRQNRRIDLSSHARAGTSRPRPTGLDSPQQGPSGIIIGIVDGGSLLMDPCLPPASTSDPLALVAAIVACAGSSASGVAHRAGHPTALDPDPSILSAVRAVGPGGPTATAPTGAVGEPTVAVVEAGVPAISPSSAVCAGVGRPADTASTSTVFMAGEPETAVGGVGEPATDVGGAGVPATVEPLPPPPIIGTGGVIHSPPDATSNLTVGMASEPAAAVDGVGEPTTDVGGAGVPATVEPLPPPLASGAGAHHSSTSTDNVGTAVEPTTTTPARPSVVGTVVAASPVLSLHMSTALPVLTTSVIADACAGSSVSGVASGVGNPSAPDPGPSVPPTIHTVGFEAPTVAAPAIVVGEPVVDVIVASEPMTMQSPSPPPPPSLSPSLPPSPSSLLLPPPLTSSLLLLSLPLKSLLALILPLQKPDSATSCLLEQTTLLSCTMTRIATLPRFIRLARILVLSATATFPLPPPSPLLVTTSFAWTVGSDSSLPGSGLAISLLLPSPAPCVGLRSPFPPSSPPMSPSRTWMVISTRTTLPTRCPATPCVIRMAFQPLLLPVICYRSPLPNKTPRPSLTSELLPHLGPGGVQRHRKLTAPPLLALLLPPNRGFPPLSLLWRPPTISKPPPPFLPPLSWSTLVRLLLLLLPRLSSTSISLLCHILSSRTWPSRSPSLHRLLQAGQGGAYGTQKPSMVKQHTSLPITVLTSAPVARWTPSHPRLPRWTLRFLPCQRPPHSPLLSPPPPPLTSPPTEGLLPFHPHRQHFLTHQRVLLAVDMPAKLSMSLALLHLLLLHLLLQPLLLPSFLPPLLPSPHLLLPAKGVVPLLPISLLLWWQPLPLMLSPLLLRSLPPLSHTLGINVPSPPLLPPGNTPGPPPPPPPLAPPPLQSPVNADRQ